MPEKTQQPFGLYVHIPFCERKCPYCDFNTYAGLGDLFATTVAALEMEMARWQERLSDRRFTSVFIGGGTPTVLNPRQLEQLLSAIRRFFQLAENCEITCEANPGTVDQAMFQHLHDLGVNRLSLGVQSFQPEELEFLGRIHGAEDVGQAFAAARAAGFENINLDFMFGLPGQTEASWDATLEGALDLAPEHLSLYSLIVEPNTPLYHWVETGRVAAPDEDVAGLLYEQAMAKLEQAGYVQYEVSNWAKSSGTETVSTSQIPERTSQHNLLYWRNQEYLGIGPGAHSHLRQVTTAGKLQSSRWGNHKPVPGYVRRVRQGETVAAFSEMLDEETAMGETMMLGLRLVREGVPLTHFRQLHDAELLQVFAKECAQLAEMGLLEIDSERVRLSHRGLMVGNQVFTAFMPEPVLGSDDRPAEDAGVAWTVGERQVQRRSDLVPALLWMENVEPTAQLNPTSSSSTQWKGERHDPGYVPRDI